MFDRVPLDWQNAMASAGDKLNAPVDRRFGAEPEERTGERGGGRADASSSKRGRQES